MRKRNQTAAFRDQRREAWERAREIQRLLRLWKR